MAHSNTQTNGASLEDCHANFFALTDVCGIKWIVFRENDPPLNLDPGEDQVLQSFSRCLEAELLVVWRRVPKRDLVTYTIDMSGNQVPSNPRSSGDDKNLQSQRKELWIFWYGDKPEDQFKKLVSSHLKEIEDKSGTWETGLDYEARTLFFKALNNLLERSLLSKDFVRLGKWFVQPFDGPEKALNKSSHLSFAFTYFVHGESSVCASVDVRQHPPVRRLSLHHLNTTRGQSAPCHVILAPYGLAATLTGVTYKATDRNVDRLLKDWHHFYPLDRNRYFCQDSHGDLVAMPPAVEVNVAGVRMIYPTCYVLATDLDEDNHFSHGGNSTKSMHTFRNSETVSYTNADMFHVEPSPYTTSNHPLLCESGEPFDLHSSGHRTNSASHLPYYSRSEQVWQDGLLNSSDLDQTQARSDNNPTTEMLAQWDFANPGRIVRKKSRNRQMHRDKSKEKSRFNSKIPFHKKAELVDELAWALDQSEMLGGSNRLSGPNGSSNVMGPPGSVGRPNDSIHHSIASPASVGPLTPAPGAQTPKAPGSVKTPGDVTVPLMSPHPQSNGPLTPMDVDNRPPHTPKSVPTYPGHVHSPYTSSTDKKPEIKTEPLSSDTSSNGCNSAFTSAHLNKDNESDQPSSESSATFKRPALPLKEYEPDLQHEDSLSDTIYDYQMMQHWLNHPVKKFRPNEQKGGDPLRPMYRRNSQADVFNSCNAEAPPPPTMKVKTEGEMNGDVVAQAVKRPGKNDPYEFPDGSKKAPEDPENLFSENGLKPSMADLDNLFDDDSSDETDGTSAVPTPPGSNKPATNHDDADHGITKLNSKLPTQISKSDPMSHHHDQLAKMFPTPPSLEHYPIASPADMDTDMKNEPTSPAGEFMDWSSDEQSVMFTSSKFAPLSKLYSDDLPPISLPNDCHYKPRERTVQQFSSNSGSSSQQQHSSNVSGPNSVATPLGTPGGTHKPGMSPISPMTSVEGPRSHHGPGSVGTYPGGTSGGLASPASVSSNYMNKSNTPHSNHPHAKSPEANALVLNLILSDTLLNLFRDHNFDSCTLCVCNCDGSIRSRDACSYLPDLAGDEDVNCHCGYSAVMNRKLAHQSGLFYEDETEVTSITEDMYSRKKPSLLHLDPKYSDNHNEQTFNENSKVVDIVPQNLLELIHRQSSSFLSSQNSLVKYSHQYLRSSAQQPSISMVEQMDNNDVIFVALDQIKNKGDGTTAVTKLDEAKKGTCIHQWTLLQAPGPYCSEDIIRVMKSLQPVLNDALHVKKASSSSTVLSVQGPLTWRQFHRMAGPATKGNTDDQCEPLPVPLVTVGHEKDFLNLSPLALNYWEALSLEPVSTQRDIAYIVVAPENDLLLSKVKVFFKNLSNAYEACRLGRHAPVTKIIRDGVMKIGKSMATRIANDDNKITEPWFDLIGEYPTASLLKLYSQVIRMYLLPTLLSLQLDKGLLETSSASKQQIHVEKPPPSPMPPPTSLGQDISLNDDLNGGKENLDSPTADDSDTTVGQDTPAIVIYILDPFSFGVENCDMNRLSNLGLLRCFEQILPFMTDQLRNNIHLQIVSLESVFELSQSKQHAQMSSLLKGLAFSVYNQAQRPLQLTKEFKILTGFGPSSNTEKYLKGERGEEKAKFVRHLYCPAYILAPPPVKKKMSDTDSFGSSNERSSVLFCNYCLSEDQHWLLASASDDRGELLKTVIINIEIPNKTRRKKASARRVGLRKLMDWILGVMATSLVPWRLVVGRVGRIGHGELRGWSVMLSKKALKKASRQLSEMCCWKSDVPKILSACLVSMEPDSNLRLFADQFTPDERFGQTASNCQLSTPKDTSCTHILVFPTSATAQSTTEAFKEHQERGVDDDLFGLEGIDDLDPMNDGEGLGDIGLDLFNDPDWSGVGNPTSPSSPKRNSSSHPGSPGAQNNGQRSEGFLYGQEEPGERIDILHQPLALGYMVSTAKTGPMPRWFWVSCPHLENVCPVFLKSALHINVGNALQGGDEGFMSQVASGRVHSLDSTFTADVLRYVLEGYNALSWLSLDAVTHDRRSCLPVHMQILLQMYNNLASLL